MKATFQLSMLTDPSVPIVLFNAPLADKSSGTIDPSTGLRKWVFEASPVMSSYLIAFALGKPLREQASYPQLSREDSRHMASESQYLQPLMLCPWPIRPAVQLTVALASENGTLAPCLSFWLPCRVCLE